MLEGMVSGSEVDRNKSWIDPMVKWCPIVTKVLKLQKFDSADQLQDLKKPPRYVKS
jgi:hypothetical protein